MPVPAYFRLGQVSGICGEEDIAPISCRGRTGRGRSQSRRPKRRPAPTSAGRVVCQAAHYCRPLSGGRVLVRGGRLQLVAFRRSTSQKDAEGRGEKSRRPRAKGQRRKRDMDG